MTLPGNTLAGFSVHQSRRVNTEEELGGEEDEDEKNETLEEGGTEEGMVAINLWVQSSELIHPLQDLRCHGVYQAAAEDSKGAGPSSPPGIAGLAGAPPLSFVSPSSTRPTLTGAHKLLSFLSLFLVSLFKRLVFILSFCLA